MPKEVIHPSVPNETQQNYAEVGWMRDGYVSIGTRAGGDYDEPNNPRPGVYADLDRDQVNRLIRALRKARDQAYGADA